MSDTDHSHHEAPAAFTGNKTVESVMKVFNIFDAPVTFFRGLT